LGRAAREAARISNAWAGGSFLTAAAALLIASGAFQLSCHVLQVVFGDAGFSHGIPESFTKHTASGACPALNASQFRISGSWEREILSAMVPDRFSKIT